MKKLPICILAAFLQLINAYSQSLEADYLVTISDNENPLFNKTKSYKLIANNYLSAYFNLDENTNFEYEKFIDEFQKKKDVTFVKLGDNHYGILKEDYFYKNYQKNEVIFNEFILSKKVIIKEELDKFQWKISPNKDTIFLNQKCNVAKTTFRGRNYTAYFSNQKFSYGGPWKFDGLPGLILKVFSDDGYYSIEAVQLSIQKDTVAIKNPYLKEKDILSWEAYETKFKEKMLASLKHLKSISQEGEDGSIKMANRIEKLNINQELKF